MCFSFKIVFHSCWCWCISFIFLYGQCNSTMEFISQFNSIPKLLVWGFIFLCSWICCNYGSMTSIFKCKTKQNSITCRWCVLTWIMDPLITCSCHMLYAFHQLSFSSFNWHNLIKYVKTRIRCLHTFIHSIPDTQICLNFSSRFYFYYEKKSWRVFLFYLILYKKLRISWISISQKISVLEFTSCAWCSKGTAGIYQYMSSSSSYIPFPGLESGQISMSVAMEKLSLVAYILITWKSA